MRLDCSTLESALNSVAAVLGLSEAALREFAARDLDWGQGQLDGRHVVLAALGYIEETAAQPQSVRWFHATRVPVGTDFAAGILPFDRAYEEMIRPLLRALGEGMVGADEWGRFEAGLAASKSKDAERLRLKRRYADWQGPFAHLLRHRAMQGFEPPLHRSYTEAPEVVEEICREFTAKFQLSLLEPFQAATARCVVSFTQAQPPLSAIGNALSYVYFSLRGEKLPDWCDTTFSGYGHAVPKAEIDDIVLR